MKLIDSSAWIEFYRKEGKNEYKSWISKAIGDNETAVNGIIQAEILSFTKTRSDYNSVFSDFSSLHNLELNAPVFSKTSEIGLNLRNKGITIPLADLIIASCALVYDTELIHFDSHYRYLSEHYPLKLTDVF